MGYQLNGPATGLRVRPADRRSIEPLACAGSLSVCRYGSMAIGRRSLRLLGARLVEQHVLATLGRAFVAIASEWQWVGERQDLPRPLKGTPSPR